MTPVLKFVFFPIIKEDSRPQMYTQIGPLGHIARMDNKKGNLAIANMAPKINGVSAHMWIGYTDSLGQNFK